MDISIREIQFQDCEKIASYWLDSDPDFLIGLGADLEKIPTRKAFIEMLSAQIKSPIEQKLSYALIWILDGQPIGHCNVNQIEFGKKAYMHLHLWKPELRQKGLGIEFVKLCIAHFFKQLELVELYCEPYALNPSPNKTLSKLGFDFIKEHTTIPGNLCFKQSVNLWHLTKSKFDLIISEGK